VSRLGDRLAGLPAVSLEELDARAALQRRVDEKYLVSWDEFERLVAALAGDHEALEIDGARAFAYESVYFDTPDLRNFHDHVEGRTPRVKLRSRLYADAGVSAFEVKVKRADGDMDKAAMAQDAADHGKLTPEARRFALEQLGEALGMDELPQLERTLVTRFERATLVSVSGADRITCDTGLELRRPDGSAVRLVEGRVLLESKSESGDSDADRLLRELGIEPISMSKYRTGIGLLAERDPEPQLGGEPQRWLRPVAP